MAARILLKASAISKQASANVRTAGKALTVTSNPVPTNAQEMAYVSKAPVFVPMASMGRTAVKRTALITVTAMASVKMEVASVTKASLDLSANTALVRMSAISKAHAEKTVPACAKKATPAMIVAPLSASTTVMAMVCA